MMMVNCSQRMVNCQKHIKPYFSSCNHHQRLSPLQTSYMLQAGFEAVLEVEQ